MAHEYGFVTLITSDSYLPGALALAGALRDVHPRPPSGREVEYETVCIVTPAKVDVSSIKLLRRAFDVVVGVEVIEQADRDSLSLLGRPDLTSVVTKIHAFRLEQYKKIIFLDADVLPLRPISHLFTLPYEFAAAPDVGWPDIFNSGVFLATPGEEKFQQLFDLFEQKGSWDGGDQGLLNEWRGSDWHRLSFAYNTTPSAAYTYAPAYARFGQEINAIHFIGAHKPWHNLSWRAAGVNNTAATLSTSIGAAYGYDALVDRWFDVYDRHYRSEALQQTKEFTVQRYDAVWSQGFAAGVTLGSGGALSLDELKQKAIDGMGAAGWSGEGVYQSMPIQGRVDLIKPEPEIVDGPSTPQQSQFIAITSTEPPSPPAEEAPIVVNIPQDDYVRPKSPPMLVWNPSVEAPPNDPPNANFPESTFYPNTWDQQNDHSTPASTETSTFFAPPKTPDIPRDLLRQGHYKDIIGDHDGHRPEPDSQKVKPIFPWESGPRKAPTRKFPQGEEPPVPPVMEASISKDSSGDSSSVRTLTPPQRSSPAIISPIQGFPAQLSFTNAWDEVASITKYANRLARPSPPQNPMSLSVDDSSLHRRRRGSSNTRPEYSEDGGDEGDDEESETTGDENQPSDVEEGGRYRGRGVQTTRPRTRSRAIQSHSPAKAHANASRELRTVSTGTDPIPSPPLPTARPLRTPVSSSLTPPLRSPPQYISPEAALAAEPAFQALSPTSQAQRIAAVGGRVFDPARGVDIFKRSSEEVLARFLKMGSWEEPENGTDSPLTPK